MTTLDAAFTDEDYATLIQIVDEWETGGSAETSTNRKERAILLKAKLLLQRNGARLDGMIEPASQPSTLELAEEYMRECGIWSHFKSYLTDRRIRFN